MSSDSESIETYTSQDKPTQNMQEKSRRKYHSVYKAFMDWRNQREFEEISENVLLTYFGELSEKYKTLWTHYSMLKSTLKKNNNINIEYYSILKAFLKRKSESYLPKKAKAFTSDEVNRFIKEASDNVYLATKVALIMGVMGACHANELHSLKLNDIQDLGSAFIVTIPNIKTKLARKFTITDNFYKICKKYFDLRPDNITSTSFFINYQKGKCTPQNIGINKFGAMGKQIAMCLKLPDPEMYSGHSFRRSSTTLVVDAAGHFTNVKKRSWKYTTVEEVNVEIPKKNEQSTSTTHKIATTNQNMTLSINSKPFMHFNNCSNFTINFINNK